MSVEPDDRTSPRPTSPSKAATATNGVSDRERAEEDSAEDSS